MKSDKKTQGVWLGCLLRLALLCGLSVGVPLGQARAQPVDVVCGQTLTTDTVMANDLNDCPGDGLILGDSDIRLDCAFHTLMGSGTGIGIRIPSGVGGVEIVNCEIIQFGTGIDIAGQGASPNLIANNVFNNAMNVQVPDDIPNRWDYHDGLVVAFRSSSTNLVMDDTNGQHDVFVHDRLRATTSVASITADGVQGDGRSTAPVLSADGRIVVFSSRATNLVADDTNGFEDIFMQERRTGGITRLNLTPDGGQADGNSVTPTMSADGGVVAFESVATNLIVGDTNALGDIYLHDHLSGSTTRISLAVDGAEPNGRSVLPALSADGSVVAFDSFATNLVATDTNDARDVFVYDRLSGATARISLSSAGVEGNGVSMNATLSATGDIVAFQSAATNLVEGDTNSKSDIFVHDRSSGTTSRVSIATGGAEADRSSSHPVLSASGRFVAFRSAATNLVPDDTNDKADIFVHDRQTGATTRVSVGADGMQATGNSEGPLAMTGDGRVIAFQSFASNLVPNDTEEVRDTFVHDRLTGTTTRVSIDSAGNEANRGSFNLAMNAAPYETNIAGGLYLGGNVYVNPEGTGFSQTCADADGDGFCDSPNTLSAGNVDRFPLKITAP